MIDWIPLYFPPTGISSDLIPNDSKPTSLRVALSSGNFRVITFDLIFFYLFFIFFFFANWIPAFRIESEGTMIKELEIRSSGSN